MLTAHELFGFMSASLAHQILDFAFTEDKDLYRLTVNAVAESRKLRPAFLERKPRQERHADLATSLAKPRLDLYAGNLIRGWLVKKHAAMLADFLNALGVAHKDGVVDELPATVADGTLDAAIEVLLGKYPKEEVIVYLNAFYSMNEVHWLNLKTRLENDTRLQFGS